MPVSVLLADNSEILRRAIRELLENHTEIECVGEAADFTQMVYMARRVKPDVIVVDLRILDLAPTDFRAPLPLGPPRLLGVSIANDVDAKLFAASVGISVLLDKAKLSHDLVPTILNLPSTLARAPGNSA